MIKICTMKNLMKQKRAKVQNEICSHSFRLNITLLKILVRKFNSLIFIDLFNFRVKYISLFDNLLKSK